MSYDPTYKSGDWLIICDVCGKKMKASDSKKRWDGFIVCPDDWEMRHPLDFLRARQDRISVPFQRPESSDTYITVCTAYSVNGVADVGTADCAHADFDNGIRYNCTPTGRSGIADLATADCARADIFMGA